MHDFSQFGLCGPILNALARQGYTRPTPIQQQAIPPVVAGRDVCGIAQTGTGKTAAFALPVLHRLAASGGGRNPDVSGLLVKHAEVGNTRLRSGRSKFSKPPANRQVPPKLGTPSWPRGKFREGGGDAEL